MIRQSSRMRTAMILSCALILFCVSAPSVQAKDKVESITDLPVRTYPTQLAPSQMILDPVVMSELRAKVRTDILDVLDRYEIGDKALLKRFYGAIANIALLEGRHDEALDYLARARELEDKEAARLMMGLNASALIAARNAGEKGSEAYESAFSKSYVEQLDAMPWDVVQDMVQGMKGRSEIITATLIQGLIQSRTDAVVAETGEMNDEMAEGLIGMQLLLEEYLPLVPLQLSALQAKIDANRVEKENIWPAREVTLDASADHATVVVGIWDSGVDAAAFGDQMWTNTAETYNGLDDDGNGFVDDLHGIAYDMFGAGHPEILHPVGDQAGKVESGMQFMKGMTDLQAAIDSPEATQLKKHIGALPPEQVQDFFTTLGFIGLYAHGSHVAGIAVAGNPFAEILCARIAFDYHSKPAPILLSAAQAHAKSYAETAEYFRAAGVRVVNMSWGWSFEEVESSLEANGIGESAEERQKMTEDIFGALDAGLFAAMKSTPEILYCVAAGNDDNDVKFNRNIPSTYELPNVMVVGAVDQAGERTSFTSMGSNVVVYANGFEVMSTVPGGAEMAMSGTSMASPNAANLAAKMFAVDPSLTPAEAIALIEKGADELESDSGLKVVNPKKTIALVEKARASR